MKKSEVLFEIWCKLAIESGVVEETPKGLCWTEKAEDGDLLNSLEYNAVAQYRQKFMFYGDIEEQDFEEFREMLYEKIS
ncbi:MAG: hypothetical protein RMK89_04255 [Armatimonadota bacterium]|nr:hypothetical protein [Armatimonadota bacterium]MDW8142659.1 hypothetical protein [Armatimonadota bacterium]